MKCLCSGVFQSRGNVQDIVKHFSFICLAQNLQQVTFLKQNTTFWTFSGPNVLFFQSLVLLIKSNALIGERAVDHFPEETDSRLAASVNFGQGKY